MNLRMMAWSMVVAAGAAVTLHAHPGHAPFSEGTKHFVTSPVHLGTALLFSAALCATAQLLKGHAERNFVRVFAAAIAVVAILA